MADYRLYRLDGTSRIAGAAEVISAADDETALAAVRDADLLNRCELWQGHRLVGLVEPAAATPHSDD
jgi:hypothetical protein